MYILYHEYSTYHQKTFVKNAKNAKPKTLHIICKLPPFGGRPFSSMRMWREESGFTPSVLVGLTAGIHLRFRRMGINPHRFCWFVGWGKVAIFGGTTKRMEMFPKIQGAFCEEETGRIWAALRLGLWWFPVYSDPVSSCHWLPATSLKASPETPQNQRVFSTLLSAWTVPPRWWDIGWSPQYGDDVVMESQPIFASFFWGGNHPCP